MSTNIKLKRSAVEGKIPTTTNLDLGELAINTNDGKLFFKKDDGTEAIVTVQEVTENNLAIDSSGLDNTNSNTLAGVINDLDGAITSGGGGGSGVAWTVKTGNYTASSNDYLIADTSSGAFTITLPSTPSTGDFVVIADGADFSANKLTVARNGSTIEGVADDFELDIQHVKVEFVYDGTTWQVFPTITSAPRPEREVENTGQVLLVNVGTDFEEYFLLLETGNVFSHEPSEITTGYVFSSPPAIGTAYGFTFKVTPSATVSITWPASVVWPEGTAPDAPASGETDVFTFYTQDGGTTWYGFQAGDNMS